jgi:hypothetical protein
MASARMLEFDKVTRRFGGLHERTTSTNIGAAFPVSVAIATRV